LLGHTIGRLVDGQMGELRTQYDPSRTRRAYLDSIGGKTASLFAAAARTGGIVAGLDRAHIEALTKYAMSYGMVFQIVDDLLDLTATEAQLGKPAGHDVVEGVYTLPVIATLDAGGPGAGELRDLLGKPIEGAGLDKTLAIVRSGPGVAEARGVARTYAAEAAEVVHSAFGASDVVDALTAAPLALIDSLL